MIVSFSDFPAQYRQQIASFMSVRPVPQLPDWVCLASAMYDKGAVLEAFYIFDLIVSIYGKETARIALERFTGVPMFMCGRGIPCSFDDDISPVRYLLRDRMMPLRIGKYIFVRSGANAVAVSPEKITSRSIHLFSPKPTHTGFSRFADIGSPVDWIAVGSSIAVAAQSDEIIFTDLAQIDPRMPLEIANDTPLLTARLTFDMPVRHLCGPLADGTFFVTLASPIPVLSDECRLCAVDLDKIRAFEREYPELPCDIREIGALVKEIVLTNTEQTLCGDCAAAHNAFVTCGGGMQSREVRFIAADGSWKTRFIHEHPVISVIPTAAGPVSLDDSGRAFLWCGESPVDDRLFALEKIDPRDGDPGMIWSVDWKNSRLYMTSGDKACCCDDHGSHDDFIVHTAPGLAFLADGSLHFRDERLSMIDPRWQLPQSMAAAEDWRDILMNKSPAIELDPRIRMIER